MKIYRNFLVVAQGQFGSALSHQSIILDTGTAPSIVNARLADGLGLAERASTMTVLGKTIEAKVATLPHFELGPIHAVSLRVQIQDLSRVEHDLGIQVAGIIGLDVLSNSSFRIDYDRKRIEFGDVSSEGIPVSVDAQHKLAVARVMLEGKPLRMLVDTGTDRVVLLGKNFGEAERFGLRSTSQEGSSVAEHAVPMKVFSVPEIFVGGQRFAVGKAYFIPGGTDPAFDGLLGVRALGFRAIAYDHAASTIYLQK